jgi:hypothetical protein
MFSWRSSLRISLQLSFPALWTLSVLFPTQLNLLSIWKCSIVMELCRGSPLLSNYLWESIIMLIALMKSTASALNSTALVNCISILLSLLILVSLWLVVFQKDYQFIEWEHSCRTSTTLPINLTLRYLYKVESMRLGISEWRQRVLLVNMTISLVTEVKFLGNSTSALESTL